MQWGQGAEGMETDLVLLDLLLELSNNSQEEFIILQVLLANCENRDTEV